MKDFIFIAGAPGSGKTTISKLLAEKLGSFVIDFGKLREFHLKPDWSNESAEEEEMSFENLIFILKNYNQRGYKNVIVNDLQDFRIQQIPKLLSKINFVIFSLIVNDNAELKKRIESERESGYKNVEKALKWNGELTKRPEIKNEYKIDNTTNAPQETLTKLLPLLS
ncbi:MAG: hypothetical protein COT81_02005 [Candidatus Buchananbacteria bacterium CG10_big_fil_rev_8_21_14_0_10_42_9]|uniref:Uncharacterized protein n=1 Tax=Candidatus Buchananbacteria bacterium CG10_big_fil_rev_8_21_14_0_10_42_9 TaxID=1974526 RepID=A0A2H0W1N7_9BACT|nr:MAG: hypothetical protein COT81_02005 [Candidatus Buchananbacteria bacterium CG10_big_fil_rev_8_21_14_0_10_42_9]